VPEWETFKEEYLNKNKPMNDAQFFNHMSDVARTYIGIARGDQEDIQPNNSKSNEKDVDNVETIKNKPVPLNKEQSDEESTGAESKTEDQEINDSEFNGEEETDGPKSEEVEQSVVSTGVNQKCYCGKEPAVESTISGRKFLRCDRCGYFYWCESNSDLSTVVKNALIKQGEKIDNLTNQLGVLIKLLQTKNV